MNTVTVKIITVLLSLFAIITVSNQIYMHVYKQYDTEIAAVYSSATEKSFYGVFVRNEEPVSYSGSGAVSYPMPDGGKAAKGSVLAYIYGSEEDIIINGRIDRLKSEIELLESAQSLGTTEGAEPGQLSLLIDEKYRTIATELAKKDLSSLSSDRNSFLSIMNTYRISIGEEEDYDDRIDKLTLELNTLEDHQKAPKKEITSDKTGYFVSFTDGYEKQFNTDSIDSITADDIKTVIDNEKSGKKKAESNEIGKLIDGYGWKMVGIIDNSENVYASGDKVKLRFASTSDTVSATIEKLTETDDPKETIICLDCDQMTFSLVKNRVERVEMILHDYEGIRVSRDALRFNRENEKGAYILMGQRVLFKKIDVVYECDEYLLSRITSDTSYVNVYDEIIISGVNTSEYYALEEEDAEEEVEEIPHYNIEPQTEDDGKKPAGGDGGGNEVENDGDGEDPEDAG